MKASKRVIELAGILKRDLDSNGLLNYYNEQCRMIRNEIKLGRNPKLYQQRRDAAIIAMDLA